MRMHWKVCVASYCLVTIYTMNSSVAVIILLVCLSGMIINESEGLKITCKWGCPVKKVCNSCCDHLQKGCIGGTCTGGWIKTRCECECPSG